MGLFGDLKAGISSKMAEMKENAEFEAQLGQKIKLARRQTREEEGIKQAKLAEKRIVQEQFQPRKQQTFDFGLNTPMRRKMRNPLWD